MDMTPEDLARMPAPDLEGLRRRVLDEADRRTLNERAQAASNAERTRAVEIVRDELARFLRHGGDRAELHLLLDRVADEIEAGGQRVEQ